jgi:carboxypeptidase family protein/TonB-dependent receptor-like protein
MLSSRARWTLMCLEVACLLAAISFPTLLPAQGTGGRILGRVADPSGALLGKVKVTAVNEATGVSRYTESNDSGDYGFPDLPVGTYTLSFELGGFKKDVRKSISLDVNQVITLNMTMQLGAAQEIVDVTSEAPLVDTTSTQLGAVVNNRSVNELPLNARDTYQFLQLQPGVQSQLGSSGGTFYGSDDAGAVSVNGGRGRANNFSVNGGDANDQFANLPTIQPTPDAIDEFRVISNTFDAEYGRNSGAVVNVITKSGTNQWHGDIYEYFRNTVLNAQGFFNTVKPQENQNQFGGTFGGPIIKDRTFFFVSYEGRRVRQGISGQTVIVPTPAETTGDFSSGAPFLGGISDQFAAQALDGRPGCDTALGLLQGGINNAYVSGGFSSTNPLPWANVFPTNVIPANCQDPVAVDMLRFVPGANRVGGIYQAVPVSADTQNQFTIRFDHHINARQSFSFYYYFTNDANFQPFYNFQASGANVPGFGANVGSRYQQYNPSHTWTISNSLINEARVTYMREGQLTFQHPQSTNLVQDSCSSPAAQAVCFNGISDSSVGPNSIQGQLGTSPQYGITTGLPPNRQGVPFIGVSGGFAVGNGWEGELPQVGNSYMASDSLTWVRGNHTMKFGADVRRAQFDQTLYYNVSGDYTFNSTTENSVLYTTAQGSPDHYPGYLLGLDDSYTQGSAQREDIRNTGVYVFAQDSWKIKPSLTMNYGIRWELDTPLADALHHVQTFRPGQNSTVYPCVLSPTEQANLEATNCTAAGVQPTGLVVPGDSGVSAGLTQTYYKAFAPRIGLAYSPNPKTTIRGGWGLFYNPMEQLVLEQFGAEPPFGGSTFLPSTFLNTPFISQTGTVSPNPFNGILSPTPGTAQDWASFRPMLLYGDFQPHMRTQYTAQYNLNFQQEVARNVVFQLGYVGSQGHRLLASHDIDPAIPQTCLDLSNTLGAGTCGPFLEDNAYFVPPTVTAPQPSASASAPLGGIHIPYGPNGPTFIPPGTSVGSVAPNGLYLVGLRPYSSPNCNPYLGEAAGAGCPLDGVPVFTNIFAEDTIAAAAYNSLQASVEKRFSHGLQLQAAYTWSKSLDWASSFEETVNPFNYKSSRALSLFNSAQRFVLNYYWEFPVPRYQGFKGKALDDWSMSGILQLQSGFPIRIQTQDDAELISSLFFLSADAPQLTGPLQILNPKKNGNFYLNPSQFSDPTPGTFSTTPRSICCGPGEKQFDVTFSKRIALTEAKYFQFRADIFNLFNKTEFVNPDGNFSDSTFGQVQQARDPREVQFALKFYF